MSQREEILLSTQQCCGPWEQGEARVQGSLCVPCNDSPGSRELPPQSSSVDHIRTLLRLLRADISVWTGD